MVMGAEGARGPADWSARSRPGACCISPEGLIAQQLAMNPTVLIVNDTAFAHGGILPIHGGTYPHSHTNIPHMPIPPTDIPTNQELQMTDVKYLQVLQNLLQMPMLDVDSALPDVMSRAIGCSITRVLCRVFAQLQDMTIVQSA